MNTMHNFVHRRKPLYFQRYCNYAKKWHVCKRSSFLCKSAVLVYITTKCGNFHKSLFATKRCKTESNDLQKHLCTMLCRGVSSYFAFCRRAALRSSLVLQKHSKTGMNIRQTMPEVKPPLYSRKPPCISGTNLTMQ